MSNTWTRMTVLVLVLSSLLGSSLNARVNDQQMRRNLDALIAQQEEADQTGAGEITLETPPQWMVVMGTLAGHCYGACERGKNCIARKYQRACKALKALFHKRSFLVKAEEREKRAS